MSRPGEGGRPGRRSGEEPCVLLRVGIRPSGAFCALIGATPEPHTKSVTSGAVGAQCGRAGSGQWERAGGLRAPFEGVGPLTLQRRERKEIRGRFCVFVEGKGLVARVQRAPPLVRGSPFPAFLLLLLAVNDWRWGIGGPFRDPRNYLLLVRVVNVQS